MKVAVIRVDQSPVNPKRWCLQLECGHEVWVSASKKPTTKVADCESCRRKRERDKHSEMAHVLIEVTPMPKPTGAIFYTDPGAESGKVRSMRGKRHRLEKIT